MRKDELATNTGYGLPDMPSSRWIADYRRNSAIERSDQGWLDTVPNDTPAH